MKDQDKSQQQEEIHLGKHIKQVLASEGRTITWLAQELGCTRDNLYKIFQHSFVNTDLLFKISEVTRHDFFKDCSDFLKVRKKNGTKSSVNKKV